jgi:type I restriction enzyme R subunit
LNDTKPHGNILDFRSQQDAVNQAISLFSGIDENKSREIWLVDPAPVVIEKYKLAVEKLGVFMQEHNLVNEPQEVYSLKGDAARIAFIQNFKEVQRQLVAIQQFTDLEPKQKELVEQILPQEKFLEFKSSYLETAKQFKKRQEKEGDQAPAEIQQLDFEFVLFASAVIDYDYIMNLIADSTQNKPAKQKMSKSQVISLLKSNSNLMEDEDLAEFIEQVDWTIGQTVEELNLNLVKFKDNKYNKELAVIAHKNGLQTAELKKFVEQILSRMIFDGEKLTDLLEPLDLSWKERRVKELELMTDLVPQLKKLAQGHEISGLAAYE